MSSTLRLAVLVAAASLSLLCVLPSSFAQSSSPCPQRLKIDDKTYCFPDLISKLNFITEYAKSNPVFECCPTDPWCFSAGLPQGIIGCGGGTQQSVCDITPLWGCTCKDVTKTMGFCTPICSEAMGWTCGQYGGCGECNRTF